MDVREALRTHLVSNDVVRRPSVAGDEPPMWLEPRKGVPAPGEKGEGGSDVEVGADAVLGLFLSGGIPQAPMTDRFIRQQNIDVWIRTSTAPRATEIENEIRDQVVGKFNWNMGGLTVIQSGIWKELQPIELSEQAFTYVLGLGFELYV